MQEVRPGTGLHTCVRRKHCCTFYTDPSGCNLGRAFVDDLHRSARRQHMTPGCKPCSVRPVTCSPRMQRKMLGGAKKKKEKHVIEDPGLVQPRRHAEEVCW